MLQRTPFKTAAELNIDEDIYEALIKVLNLFERQPPIHAKRTKDYRFDYPQGNAFNMGAWAAKSECGTVMCMGGYCQFVFGVKDLYSRVHEFAEKPLNQLFWPKGPCSYYYITIEQATQALNNYLTTGEPNWDFSL